MKIVLVIVLALAAIAFADQPDPPAGFKDWLITTKHTDHEAVGLFRAFKRAWAKYYDSWTEEEYRFGVFRHNLIRAMDMNLDSHQPNFGVTQFSDMTAAEFAAQFLLTTADKAGSGSGSSGSETNSDPLVYATAGSGPITMTPFDWRNSGAVTPVKNQGKCGSCWAFSTVQTLESATFLATGDLPILAPQQLVSCDPGNHGCNGGWTPTAFEYIIANGVETATTIPYTSGANETVPACTYNSRKVNATMTSFNYAIPSCLSGPCTTQNETLLYSKLKSQGPASIIVDASNWQLYVSGVFTGTCSSAGTALNHAVQLVGYGVDSLTGTKYWIVRNSWGTNWGQGGYIYLPFGQNKCGFANIPLTVNI
jgi:cysteine peptidase B